MALQVGELYGLLNLETGPFDKGIGGIQGAFKNLGGIVTGAMAGIATAIGAGMVGAVAAADNYQKSLNKLQAQTGATTEEMGAMSGMMKDIYGAGYGQSFEEIGDALAYTAQATGATGEELKFLAQDALMLSENMDMDVNESVRSAAMLMKQFGVDGSTAMAMIAEGQQAGINSAGDMLDTINEYSVFFQQAGLDAEQMFAILENGMAAGARDTDFIADAFKEFGIIMKEDSTRAADALNAMGLAGGDLINQFAAGGPEAAAAFATVADAVANVEDPLERSQLQVELFGTKAEDLERDVIASFSAIGGSVTGSVDTLNEINELKFDSFTGAMSGIGRLITTMLIIPIGQKLLPHLTNFANWFRTNVPGIIAYFQSMFTGASGSFSGIQKVVESVIGFIGPFITSTIGAVVSWWKSNGAELLANAQIVFNGILAVINFVMPLVKAIISTVFNGIKLIISGALNFITGIFQVFAGLFTGDWSKMWTGIKNVLTGAVQLILGFMSLNFVRGLLNLFKNLATGAVKWIVNLAKGSRQQFDNFVNGLLSRAGSMVTSVLGFFRNMGTQAARIFGILRSFGESIFRALFNTIRSVAMNIYNAVRTAFSNMYNSVRNSINSVYNTAKSVFSKVKNAILNPVETAKRGVKTAIDGIKGLFSGLKLSLPNIKVPKFSIKNWSLNPADWVKAMPTIGISWHKDGGIFNGPTVAGLGEAGPEAIVPLSGHRMRPFAQEIARQMGGAAGGTVVFNAVLQLPDGRVIAELAEPHIADIQDMKNKKDKRGWGVY